jgi:hypothetical protein
MSPSLTFAPVRLPTGESAWIPSDVELKFPDRASVDISRLHCLAYIPWRDTYLARVDGAYRDFFVTVLPYLHARTTNVHVATCLPFVPELIRAVPESVDERIVTIAFILHDSGWSQMTEEEIAASLGVQGLALSGGALDPKARHAVLGREIAQRVLETYRFQPPLTDSQRDLIYMAILYHDKPEELARQGGLSAEVKLVCDVDHLWSFTHENFWQDTVRKGVAAAAYVKNLEGDLDGYFVTEPGRQQARRLLKARRAEVTLWQASSARTEL